MTRNLKIYAALNIIWSLLFFTILEWSLRYPADMGLALIIAPFTYGIGIGVAGTVLHNRDRLHTTRVNLGFWYSWLSNLISLVIGGSWILAFRPQASMLLLVMTIAFICVFAVAWLLIGRKNIKGIPTKEIFK